MGRARKVLERQGQHLLAFVGLGALLWWAASQLPVAERRAWGYSALEWIAISWVFAGVMQAWIGFFWRTELHLGWISRALGRAGFRIFQVGFVGFAAARFVPLIPISLATAHTLPMPRWLSLALIVVTAPPVLWTFYSFIFYMGAARTMGADHFDPAYRQRGLETRGIFRHLRNPAYTVGLLFLYHAGLLWESGLALLVAAVHHAFVWVAYFCGERPDVREIYGQ